MTNEHSCPKCGDLCSTSPGRPCNPCHARYARERRAKDPERSRQIQRNWQRKNPAKKLEYYLRPYGLTVGDYWTALMRQDLRCGICGTDIEPTAIGRSHKKRSVGRGKNVATIDHDHQSGIFRELTCGNCNSGLGMFNDNPQVLRKAADYIERHRV